MKVRRFVDGLNSHLTPLVHMKNPQDLEEAFDAASRAATGFDLRKKADAEASLTEQVEALQIQLAELTTGSRPAVNYVTNYTQQQPALLTVPTSSTMNPFLPQPEANP